MDNGDDIVDVFGECEYCAGFRVGRGGGYNSCLFDAAVVECTVCAVERYCVSCVAFAVGVEEV